jgi:hypothetical protein
MMRRAWQLSLLFLGLPLWMFVFLPVAIIGLFGGNGSFFDFKVLEWSWGMWLFVTLLILPPVAFVWALSSSIFDFIAKRKENA